jgi:hypothetical protein
MSGPKVVNIRALRRQQRRESATRLRELNAAIEECFALQSGGTASELRENTATLLGKLNRLREAENWEGLLHETTSHIDFYRHEAGTLRRQVAERCTQALRREHRIRRAAAEISDGLRRLPPSTERDRALERLASAQSSSSELAKATENAATLVIESHCQLSLMHSARRLREFAAAFADPAVSLPPSLPEVARDQDEQRLDRCWSLLAELEAGDPLAALDEWKQKALAASSAVSSERTLMLDSLVLELTSYIRARRAHQAAEASIKAALAEVESLSSTESSTWRARLRTALEQRISPEEAEVLVASVRNWIAQETAREDAQEQRVAVLQALSKLGYEVREGMAAAWSDEGRIIVHKPSESLYGVEFTAPATATAFQTRIVAIGDQQRSTQRDREIEEAWCGEFTRLRSILADCGFETNIAQAHQPGAVPIKAVAGCRAQDSRIELQAENRHRTQRKGN